MAAAELNIEDAEQGATFDRVIELFEEDGTTPVDISTWTFRGQVRESFDSEDVLATFVFAAGDDSNEKKLSISAANMSLIPVPSSEGSNSRKIGKYIYDIEADIPGSPARTDRIFQGAFWVSAEVTRT